MAVTHATWGVTSSVSAVSGVVTDLSVTTEAQQQPEYNEKGAVIGVVQYDKRLSATATIQVASTVSAPEVGAAVTIGSQTYYVTSATTLQNNKDFRKIQLSLEAWEKCTEVFTPAASSDS
ncbi:MAG: hypothetical protein ACI4W7_03840 [Candidatus Spyradenecus sp.]